MCFTFKVKSAFKPGPVKWGLEYVCYKSELYLTTWWFLRLTTPRKRFCMHRRRVFLFDCTLPHSRKFTSVSVSGFLLPWYPYTGRKAIQHVPVNKWFVCQRVYWAFKMACGRAWGINLSLFAETTTFTPRSNQSMASLLTTTASCFHNTVVWWVSHTEVTLHCPLCPQMCVQYQHANDLLLKNPSRSSLSFIFTFLAQPTWLLSSDAPEHSVLLFWLLLGKYAVSSGIRLSLSLSLLYRTWAHRLICEMFIKCF